MTYGRLATLAMQGTDRRTALPREHYERPMTCTRCGTRVDVFQASTHGPHEHLDPDGYVCGDCLEQAHADRQAAALAPAKPGYNEIPY